MAVVFYFFPCLITYLLLTAGSGEVLFFWSLAEIVAGIVVSLIFALITHRLVPSDVLGDLANPLKAIALIFFAIGPFFLSLLYGNLEVLYCIITGKINPAIVRVETGLKSETGVFLFANSITLSPGTLTVDIEPDQHVLYIHCLNWEKQPGEPALPQDVSLFVYGWIKRIYG